jgi:ATP-binding cassette subfamily F protein 3
MLKLFAGVIDPDGGEVFIGNNVDVAYFAQHAVDQLDPDTTVLDEMMGAADMDTAPRVRTILGTFGFSGEEVDKQVRVLSGGEKNRLALAKMMLAPAGLLLMDEPTNHLDIDSRQVLEYALNDYEGAYIVVSHDRYFVNEVAERVIHLEDGAATDYIGDYEYYRWKRADEQERREAVSEEVSQPEDDEESRKSKKELRREAAELRKRIRRETGALRKRIDTLETRIMELEETIEESEAKLADPDIYSDEDASRKWGTRYRAATEELEEAMTEWEEASLALQRAKDSIANGNAGA